MTVMTFNILGASRTRAFVDAILDADPLPDIVFLQELKPQMVPVLLAELGDVYPHRALDPRERYMGMGVLSHYPLTELDSSHIAGLDWQIQIVQAVVENRTVTLYNVHPLATAIFDYLEGDMPLAGQVRTSFQNREMFIRSLVADMQTRSTPVIIAGDFNNTDQSDAYNLLTSQLTDAHRAVGWGFGHTYPAFTWHFHGIPIPTRLIRIDMIFYSDEFIGTSCRLSSDHGDSNHLPVIAQLVLRE